MEKSINKLETNYKIGNEWVRNFFERRISRIQFYEKMDIHQEDIQNWYEYLPHKPILSKDYLSVRRQGEGNIFRIKIQMKFYHYYLRPGPDYLKRESEDFETLALIQRGKTPPELTTALRRIIGLRKGSEKFIPQFINEKETRTIRRDKISDVIAMFQRTIVIKEFRP